MVQVLRAGRVHGLGWRVVRLGFLGRVRYSIVILKNPKARVSAIPIHRAAVLGLAREPDSRQFQTFNYSQVRSLVVKHISCSTQAFTSATNALLPATGLPDPLTPTAQHPSKSR